MDWPDGTQRTNEEVALDPLWFEAATIPPHQRFEALNTVRAEHGNVSRQIRSLQNGMSDLDAIIEQQNRDIAQAEEDLRHLRNSLGQERERRQRKDRQCQAVQNQKHQLELREFYINNHDGVTLAQLPLGIVQRCARLRCEEDLDGKGPSELEDLLQVLHTKGFAQNPECRCDQIVVYHTSLESTKDYLKSLLRLLPRSAAMPPAPGGIHSPVPNEQRQPPQSQARSEPQLPPTSAPSQTHQAASLQWTLMPVPSTRPPTGYTYHGELATVAAPQQQEPTTAWQQHHQQQLLLSPPPLCAAVSIQPSLQQQFASAPSTQSHYSPWQQQQQQQAHHPAYLQQPLPPPQFAPDPSAVVAPHLSVPLQQHQQLPPPPLPLPCNRFSSQQNEAFLAHQNNQQQFQVMDQNGTAAPPAAAPTTARSQAHSELRSPPRPIVAINIPPPAASAHRQNNQHDPHAGVLVDHEEQQFPRLAGGVPMKPAPPCFGGTTTGTGIDQNGTAAPPAAATSTGTDQNGTSAPPDDAPLAVAPTTARAAASSGLRSPPRPSVAYNFPPPAASDGGHQRGGATAQPPTSSSDSDLSETPPELPPGLMLFDLEQQCTAVAQAGGMQTTAVPLAASDGGQESTHGGRSTLMHRRSSSLGCGDAVLAASLEWAADAGASVVNGGQMQATDTTTPVASSNGRPRDNQSGHQLSSGSKRKRPQPVAHLPLSPAGAAADGTPPSNKKLKRSM